MMIRQVEDVICPQPVGLPPPGGSFYAAIAGIEITNATFDLFAFDLQSMSEQHVAQHDRIVVLARR